MTIKVAIADDHPLILHGMRMLLSTHPDMCITGTYRNSRDLLEGIAQTQPDILLLDIHMPGKNGIELAGIITQDYPGTGIIALTNLDNSFYIKSMLNQGVLGYILKNSEEIVLMEAIHTVYNGTPYLEPSLRDRAWHDMVKAKTRPPEQHSLTRREKEILRLIASEHTSQEIADKLCVSHRTVDAHRTNLLLKLGVKNMVGLVKAAIQMGLVE